MRDGVQQGKEKVIDTVLYIDREERRMRMRMRTTNYS